MQKVTEICSASIVNKNAIERGKDGKPDKVLFAVSFDVEAARELPADALSLILWEAAVNFCCRTGKQVSKLQGQTLSIEACAAFLATTGSREGGPSKDDKDLAQQRMVVVKADAHKKAHDVDENDALYGDVDAFILKEIEAFAARNIALRPGLEWSYDVNSTPVDNLATFFRAMRLYKVAIV